MEDEIQGTTPFMIVVHFMKKKKRRNWYSSPSWWNNFGEHEIMFAGLDEIIEIKHTALSKDVLFKVLWLQLKALQDKEAGLFTLKQLY